MPDPRRVHALPCAHRKRSADCRCEQEAESEGEEGDLEDDDEGGQEEEDLLAAVRHHSTLP